MNHASLFSGIGGFDLAAQWMGWNNIFNCEIESFPQKILKYHFPEAINYDDIKHTDFSVHRGSIDILTGGFPCQPYSTAGKRLGKNDERHLFPEMLRAIDEIKPTWVVGENVRGLVSWNDGLVFEETQADLEAQGYEVQSFILPAAGVNAPHKRDRVWIIGYNASNTTHNRRGGGRSQEREEQREWVLQGERQGGEMGSKTQGRGGGQFTSDSRNKGRKQCRVPRQVCGKEGIPKVQRGQLGISTSTVCNGLQSYWQHFPTQPPICGGDDGIPRELDSITFSKWRKESIKGYGNAIVPQIAYRIFKSIEAYESNQDTA